MKEAVKVKIRKTRAYNLVSSKFFRLRGRIFDWRFNIETARDVDIRELKIDSPNLIHGVMYAATDPKSFIKLFDSWEIEFEKFSFVDFGSGKGRVLMMASEYPFKKITGIEFSSELNEAALKNIKNYKSPSQKCRRIEAVNLDAALFVPPGEPTVFYIFNPFRPQVLEQVVGNIERSLEENPREIYFVYANPLHEEILKNSRFFEHHFSDAWYSIYKSKTV